jgi:hypothetical protein
MDHARFKNEHTAALYVSGGLDERTQEAFEMHLMRCEACLSEVELWRAMRTGMRDGAAANAPVIRSFETSRTTQWGLAASVAIIAIGSGAAGWYGHSFSGMSVSDEDLAVFSLPPVTRGADDCVPLPIGARTEIVALRVPNANPGLKLELTSEDGTLIADGDYSVRPQADGSWLLRVRAKPFAGQLLRLQTRGSNVLPEPLGCVIVSESLPQQPD